MKVVVSAAISADGYLDDSSDKRLVLSNDEDWQQVYELRASCDAILVGAQTVRADNPSLTVKDERLRAVRVEQGLNPDIAKVVVSGSGKLDPDAKFFTVGDCRKIVIVSADADRVSVEALRGVATIVELDTITAHGIIGALEAFDIKTLMVEGGGCTLKMFFDEREVDGFRLAVAPVEVADASAPRLDGAERFIANGDQAMKQCEIYFLGAMKVIWLERADIHYMKMAIELSRNCKPTTTSYCVGAMIVTRSGELFGGYTHQTAPANHAEEEAIAAAVGAGAELCGATIYSSIEPCSTRSSKPKSCSALIIDHRFSRVVFAIYEPDRFVKCEGARLLLDSGITVEVIDELADQVREINSHII